MKILFCLPGDEWGGPGREPVGTLAAALAERADVSFVLFSRHVSGMRREGNVTTVPCRASVSRSMLDLFQQERKAMAGEIRRQKPDLVHVHWTQMGHALAVIDSGIPYVVTVHDAALTSAFWNWSWYPPAALSGLVGLWITRKVLRYASHIIAVSPYVARHVQRFFLRSSHLLPDASRLPDSSFHISQSSISVIPNPVALAPISPTRDRTPQPSAFRLPPSDLSGSPAPVFAAIGHWGRLKNFDLILRAFRLVRGRMPAARLCLIGKGLGEGTPCHTWAIRRALDAGVCFVESMPHSDLQTFLAEQVDCLVHPSRTEGFGLVVAEAMAAGVPVIASDAGALPWLLEDGKAGRIVSVRTAPAWAAAMIEAGEEKDARTRKIPNSRLDHARHRIAELCDPQRAAERHMEVYRKVASL